MIDRTLWESAVELQSFLARSGFPFCFIGGIAYQRWGEPRTTDDLSIGGLPYEHAVVRRSTL